MAQNDAREAPKGMDIAGLDFEKQTKFMDFGMKLLDGASQLQGSVEKFFKEKPHAVMIYRELVAKYSSGLSPQSGVPDSMDFITKMRQEHASLSESAGLTAMLLLAYAKKSGFKLDTARMGDKKYEKDVALMVSNALADFDKFVQTEKPNYKGEDFKDIEGVAAMLAGVGMLSSREYTKGAATDARKTLDARHTEAMVDGGMRLTVGVIDRLPPALFNLSSAEKFFEQNGEQLQFFRELTAKYMAENGMGDNAFDMVSRLSGKQKISEVLGLLAGIVTSFAVKNGFNVENLDDRGKAVFVDDAMEDFAAFVKRNMKNYPTFDLSRLKGISDATGELINDVYNDFNP